MRELDLLDDQELFARTYTPRGLGWIGAAFVAGWLVVALLGGIAWAVWHFGAMGVHAIQKAIGG